MVSLATAKHLHSPVKSHISRLVATLGSRSIARRLNRRAILDVDVPEACKVIIDPEAPMALRLQGSLL